MKKTFEGKELIPFLHNALRTEVNGQGELCVSRFTEFQLERYGEVGRELDYDFMPRTRASSGVTLDFYTDSDTLALTYSWEAVTAAEGLSLDLLVDGVFYEHFYKADARNQMAGFALPEGEHRVTLVFPWSCDFRLKSLTLGEGAKFRTLEEREGKRLRILCLGDSITQGYYAERPAMTYASTVARNLNAECLNQSIGGFLFEERVLDPVLKDWDPDLILLAYGTNDYGFSTGLNDYRERAAKFLEKLNALFPNTKILGIMPIYRNDSNCFARVCMKDYSIPESHQALRELYANYPNVSVLEDDYYPHSPDFFAPDFLHPNDLGFQIYAGAVEKKIRKILSSANS